MSAPVTTVATPGRQPVVTLFGEPVALPGLIELIFPILIAFHVLGQDLAGVILAFLQAAFGLYTSWATKETALAAFVALFKAGVTLAATLGLHLDVTQSAAVLALSTFILTAYHRSNANPISGSPSGPPAPQPVVVTNEPVEVTTEDAPSDATSASGSGTGADDPAQAGVVPPGAGGDGGF